MTELLSDIDTPSDAELISRVRGGDVAAYGELFSRHVSAANRLARQLVRGPDADDLVSEAFAKVLQVLQGGGGPDVAFRAYLLTSVRRLHVDRVRAGARLQTTDDLTPFDPGIPFQDTAVAGFESGAAAKAFASLPERWQLVLWHLEVEGQKPAEIAPLLGMSANSVSALAYRAREGLRQAFLTMHLSDISDTDCRWVNEHLGAYVRNGLSKRDSAKVRAHLDGCRRCTAMYLELTEVNSDLSGIIAPLLLGAAATGYLASSAGGAGAAGVLGLVGRARDTVMANAGAATAGAVAAGVAAAAVVGIALTTGKSDQTTTGADTPVGTVATAPASPGASASPKPSVSPSASAPAAPSASAPAGAPGLLVPAAPGQTAPAAPGPAAPSPAPGDNPTSGPTDNPTSGPTDNPTSGPTDNPTSGPTDNPTSGPTGGPTDNPTSGPTDNPTSGPTPGGTPTPTAPGPPPPATVEADVSVEADFGPTGASATLTVRGSTTLPPTLDIGLSSAPGGITFAPGGNCQVSSSTLAHCTLVGGNGGGSALARTSGAVTAAGTPFVATLFFNIPAAQPDTDLSLAVSVPDGYADPDMTNNTGSYHYSRPTPKTEAPLVMGDLSPNSATPGDAGRYQLTGHVSGIPSTVSALTFELAGDAAFDAATADCTVTDAHHVACPTDGATLSPHFVVTATGATPANVSITVQVPDGYVDTSKTGGLAGTEDNSAPATLLAPVAPPAPSADVSVTNLRPDPVTPEGDGTYKLVADVAGFPKADSPDAVYTLGGAATFVPGAGSGTVGCTTGDDLKTLTCPGPTNGTVVVQVHADDNAADTSVTLSVAALTGYDDPDPSNNTSNQVTLGAAQPADLGLSLPATTHEDRNDPTANTFTLDADVSGLPDGVDSVALSQTGARGFAGGEGCSGGEATVTCKVVDGQVHPKVLYPDEGPATVRLTAATPNGYVDPTAGEPASDSTELQPEAFTGLAATATLALTDQNSGQLTVTISGAATGRPLTLTLSGKNEHAQGMTFQGVSDGSCQAPDKGNTATCDPGTTRAVFDVDVPPGLLDGTVTVDDGAHTKFPAPFSGAADAVQRLLIPTGPLARVTRPQTTPPAGGLDKAIERETQRRLGKPRAHPHAKHGHAKHAHSSHAKAHQHAKKSKPHRHGGHGHAKAGKHGGAVRLLLGGLLGSIVR